METMHKSTMGRRILYWAPRVFCLLFAVWISVFALDAFDGAPGFWTGLGRFLLHLVPTYLVLGLLALAWRWEWVGAVAFTGLAVLYLVTAWGRFHWSAYALISGPLFVLGFLFLANWVKRRELRAAS